MSRAAAPPLWLASRSPRRRAMLEEQGVRAIVRPSDLDDGRLAPGRVPASWWVAALAYLKARRVAELLDAEGEPRVGVVLGADTICAMGEVLVGQPDDADAARALLRRMRGGTHRVLTGVCAIDRGADAPPELLVDAATVRWGDVADEAIDAYVASGGWRGKAGGYNLAERVAAGWPILCEGDPATVMGLPVARLDAWLDAWRGPR